MARLIMWLLDAIVLFLLIRMVFRLITGGREVMRRGPWARQDPPRQERLGGTLVRDPQCGTYLPESRALQARAGGETLYFCSVACRDAYHAAHT